MICFRFTSLVLLVYVKQDTPRFLTFAISFVCLSLYLVVCCPQGNTLVASECSEPQDKPHEEGFSMHTTLTTTGK